MMRMGMKRVTFLWGALLFLVTMVMLYTMLDTLNSHPNGKRENYNILESKISKLEKDLNEDKAIVKALHSQISQLLTGKKVALDKETEVLLNSIVKDTKSLPDLSQINQEIFKIGQGLSQGKNQDSETCSWADKALSNTDLHTHQMLEKLSFDNPDGGAWKQGWDVTYPRDKWTAANKLRVVLVPHTHCDPGWIKTFDDYYRTETRKILDSFVPKLEQNNKYKFMFSEISYFSLWWSEISSDIKERVKRLIANGQFEISTGGWVMTDEANAHYFAMLDQLIEGNQWLNNTLGYVPQSGWSIDPFGYSSTMAYLLRRSEFKSMLIQRVHYSIKKHLARESNLEFMWRQHWDKDRSTDIFTHMMPFYSYDVPHTCGPEPAVCCQFDFRRLPGSSIRCPWMIDPKPISSDNVADRVKMIIDQWKKKATLYKTNAVLIPLGDDFRYMTMEEFDAQFGNYQKIFDYLNSHPELGVTGEFGTLTDYFNAVYADTNTKPGQQPATIPSLSGDFFSYADRDDHYWTGYFTSRPIQKNLDRVLENNLRSAEILFSLAMTQVRKTSSAQFPSSRLMKLLVESRRSLGLFQHHDAITGTAKDFVVVDYGNKLLKAVHSSKRIIAESAAFLLANQKTDYQFKDHEALFDMDEIRDSHDSLPRRPVLHVTDVPKSVLFYNSLANAREEQVEIWLDSPFIQLTDDKGEVIHTQIQPLFMDSGSVADDKFKLIFLAKVAPIGLVRYTIKQVNKDGNPRNHLATISYLKMNEALTVTNEVFKVEKTSSISDFTLKTERLQVLFSGTTGLLQSVMDLSTKISYKARAEFIQYGVKQSKERSGAYLFLPDGQARPYTDAASIIRVIQGPLSSEVYVHTPYIRQTTLVKNSPGVDGAGVEMRNVVDIRATHNKEIGMRLHTGVKNTDRVFYSDLNGFQMQKRKYYDKLTLQGNVYPMPTMAYLEDDQHRVTVVTSQSSGVANLVSGALDVMFDRRLNQDDNRGLGQGVLDNHPTPSTLRWIFESRPSPKPIGSESSFPSLLSQRSSLSLIHPVFAMPVKGREFPMSSELSLLRQDLGCELHLLNMRTLQNSDDNRELQYVPQDASLLLLRHLPTDCSFLSGGVKCSPSNGKVVLSELFQNANVKQATSTSLTMSQTWSQLTPGSVLKVAPMEIAAVKVVLS